PRPAAGRPAARVPRPPPHRPRAGGAASPPRPPPPPGPRDPAPGEADDLAFALTAAVLGLRMRARAGTAGTDIDQAGAALARRLDHHT
ncbi:hypothetical protein ABZ815_47390, partial [Nonomuraea sp. NPDC047529]|uniref:hypothetical protein n=1 Tax=Nonomuraea sp. NPDC047529 TaxID=3155623 RepID=UPI0033CE7F69